MSIVSGPTGSGGTGYTAQGLGGAAVDVTNTAVETDLCSFVIPANALGANGRVRLYMTGDLLWNTAVAGSIRLKAGATALWGVTTTQSSSAVRRAIFVTAELSNLASASANSVRIDTGLSDASVSDIGAGGLGRSLAPLGGVNNTTAVDTTASWTFHLSIQWASASTNLSMRKFYAGVEYIAIA